MKPYYKDNVKLLYTDTDSLVYEIKTNNIYKDIASKELHDNFDFSKYSDKHIAFEGYTEKEIKEIKKTSGVIGKFKDEKNGEPIQEFIGLKPKMYSAYLKDDEKEVSKKAKGIPKATSKKIKHEDYINCSKSPIIKEETFHTIKSDKHILKTVKLTKNSLSSFDDKRYYTDLINSRAIGHYLNK